MNKITQYELHKQVYYDPVTGWFIWKISKRGRKNGRIGCVCPSGYRQVSVNKAKYLEHRLAWFYMTGEWPHMIDHINRNRADNRWNNLRLASNSQNIANSRVYKTNTSGYRGVIFEKNRQKYRASIMINGKRNYLGRFDDLDEAYIEYVKASQKHFGEFANVG